MTKKELVDKIQGVYNLFLEEENEAKDTLTIRFIRAHRKVIEETFRDVLNVRRK